MRSMMHRSFALLVVLLVCSLGISNAASCSNISGILSPVTETFIVLAGAGVSLAGGTASTTLINGNIGSYPTPGTVVGTDPKVMLVNSVDHHDDTLTQEATSDLACMYSSALAKTNRNTIVSDLGGLTLVPGVYHSGTSVSVTGTLTLDGQGNADAVFLIIASSTVMAQTNSKVLLGNGTQSCNVFWVAGSSATIKQNAIFVGTVLAQVSITMNAGASLDGRLMCNSAISLDTNMISKPTCTSSTATLPQCTNCSFSVLSPVPTPTPVPSRVNAPTPTHGVPTPTPTPVPSGVNAPTTTPGILGEPMPVLVIGIVLGVSVLACLIYLVALKWRRRHRRRTNDKEQRF